VTVAIVHNLLPGGALRRLREQLRYLGSAVIEVTLEGASALTDDPRIIPLRERAPHAPRVVRPPLRYLDLVTLVRAWCRAGRLIDQLGVNAVFANPCRFLQAPPALALTRAPSVYFCDEPRRVDHEPDARASRRRATLALYAPLYIAARRFDRIGVQQASRLVTNSHFSAGEIRRAYGRTADVVPMGVSEVFRTAPDPLAPRHLLSVGKLIAGKGHERVIDAAAHARHRWPVVVAAGGEQDRPAELRLAARARLHGVDLTVRYGVSDAELRDLYRSAVATLYLARREPFGLASLEAQACGSPVIAARDGGLPETMRENVTGFVVGRGDCEGIARRIDELSAETRLRQLMGCEARAWARQATWARSAQAVTRILTEVGS